MIRKVLIMPLLLSAILCAEQKLELVEKVTFLELEKIPLFSKNTLDENEIYYGVSKDGFTVAKLCCFHVNEVGQVFIPSRIADTISVYDSTGRFIKTIGLQDISADIKELGYTSKDGPWDIVLDKDGKIYLLYEFSRIGQYPLKGPDAYLVKYSDQGKYDRMFSCNCRGYLSITDDNDILCSQPGSYVLINKDNANIFEETVVDNKILVIPIGSDLRVFFSKTFDQIEIKSGITVSKYMLPKDIINRKSYSHPMILQKNELFLYEIEDSSGLHDYEKDPFVRIVCYHFMIN